MASEKISQLPSHTASLTDVVPVANGGANYGDTVEQINQVPHDSAVVFTSAVGSGAALDALTVNLSEAAASTWDWNFQDGGVQPGTGKHDWTSQFGYNVNNNSTKKVTESAVYLGIESNYEQVQGNVSTSQTEWYLTNISPNAAGGGPAGGPRTVRVMMGTQNKLTGLTTLALGSDSVTIASPNAQSQPFLFGSGQLDIGGGAQVYVGENNYQWLFQANAANNANLPLIWLDGSNHVNVGSDVQVNLGSSSTFVAANGDTTLAGNLLVNGGTISGPVSASGLVTVDGNVTGTAAGITLSKPTLIAYTATAPNSGTVPVTTSAINTTGANFIVVAISSVYAGTQTLSDSVNSSSNTWHALTKYGSVNNGFVQLFYAYNPTVGAGHTFSVNDTQTGNFDGIAVQAFANMDITSAVYESSTGTNGTAGTTVQPGSVMAASAGDIIVTGLGSAAGYGPDVSINDSFIISNFSNADGRAMGVGLAYFSATGTGAVDPTWTAGLSSYNAAAIAVFKQAVATPIFTGNIVSSSVALTSVADLSWNADSGISRVSPNVVQIGNTAGTPDASGTLDLTKIVLTDFGSTPTSSSGGGTAGTVGEIVQHSGLLYFCSATGGAGSATWNVLTMTPSA